MRLISFDVGIRNMAYCIFDIHENNRTIVDWNVLNLLEKEPPLQHCTCMVHPKNKKIASKSCNKLAKYQKNSEYFCEKHAKTHTNWLLPTKQCSPTYLKKLKIADLISLGNSYSIFSEIENLQKTTKPLLLEIIIRFFESRCFETISIKKTKSANDIDLIQIGRNMKEQLNNVQTIDAVTHVIIENQISPIANRMKTIQGMLAQYFIMKNGDTSIEFISSANKLKSFQNDNREPVLENTITPINEQSKPINVNYSKHKKDAVFYCSQIIEKTPIFQLWAGSLQTKKKDDLADCFLQGIWYLNKQSAT
jgi:hypothetical protein